MTAEKILRPMIAAERLGISVRTLYREVAAGNIPRGIPITDRAQGWRESLIARVISDREAGRRVTTDEDSPIATAKRGPGRPRKIPHAQATLEPEPRGDGSHRLVTLSGA
jgi:predicted DNA-binding transcriptional regulator AlpA